MWKVTRRGLVAHKLRFLLTALAVVLGVAFMTGTLILTATMRQTFDDLFADIYRGTDAVVRTPEVLSSDFGTGQRPPVSASLLRAVQAVPGVAAAAGTVQFQYAQVVDAHNNPIGNPGNGAPTLGGSWNPEPKLNQFHLVEGRAPHADNEVVIDKHTADKGKLHTGTSILVLTGDVPTKYQLVGVARFGTADSLAGASIALFTMPQAQRLAHKVGKFDEIAVVAQPGITQQDLSDRITRTLFAGGRTQYEVVTGKQVTKENQDAIHKQLGFFNVALEAFAGVALLVGMFIIYNTFSIVVAQRTREMALLRAVGASRRQVLGELVGESLVVGLLASGVGAAGGLVIALGLKALFAAIGFAFPGSGLVVPPSAMIVGVGVGTVITVLMAFVPARRASRVPPIAAIRDVAIERPPRRNVRLALGGGLLGLGVVALLTGLFASVDNGIAFVGAGALAIFIGVFVLGPLFSRWLSRALGAPLPKIKGMTGTLARENASRNPKRTSTTAIALTIGVALVGFITIFAASAKASIAQVIDNQIKVDYFITAGHSLGQPRLSPKLAQAVAKLPEIDVVTGLRIGEAGIGATKQQLVGVEPHAAAVMFDFKSAVGSFDDLKTGGIAISKHEAETNHWRVGDRVPVTFVDTGRTSLRVDYIYDERTFGDFFVSIATIDQHFSGSLDFEVLARLKPGVTAAAGRTALQPLVKPYPIAKIKDEAEFKADRAAAINQVVSIIYGLLALAVFIAFIGIANTLALSIHERTRELGLLRAVGMSRSQVRSAVRWESVIISVFGSVIGLVIGLFFGWSVVKALDDQGFKKFAAAPGQLIVVVVIAALLGVGAAIIPARRAAKLDILRAISTE